MPYAGKYCEHVGAMKCGPLGVFCTNGGECPTRTETECECSGDFSGPHCEFETIEDTDDDIADDDDTDDDGTDDMDDDGTDDDKADNNSNGYGFPKCTLKCQNGGTCSFGGSYDTAGVHDLDHLYKTNTNSTEDFMSCVCPAEFGGKICDINKNPCGSHNCFHGGTCLTHTIDGVPKHHCDCTTAGGDDELFAGRFCQYQSEIFCTANEDPNGHLFCTNGGMCLDDAIKGCSCVPGFYGNSCEFKHAPKNIVVPEVYPDGFENPKPLEPAPDTSGIHIGEGKPAELKPAKAVCKLKCRFDGECNNGVKDLGTTSHLASIDELQTTYNNDFEHCVCREGYVGLRCEHRIEVCSSGTHVCMFGGKCLKDGNEDSCDCDESKEPFLAGKNCEHKSSHPGASICTKGELIVSQPRSFCVNYGTCKEFISVTQNHPGCNCVGDWEGPHCEMPTKSLTSTTMPPLAVHTTPSPTKNPVTRSPVKSSDSVVINRDAVPVVVTIEEEPNDATTTAILAVGLIALIVSVIISAYTFVRNRDFQQQILLRDANRRLAFTRTLSQTFKKNPYRDIIPTHDPSETDNLPKGENGEHMHNVEIA